MGFQFKFKFSIFAPKNKRVKGVNSFPLSVKYLLKMLFYDLFMRSPFSFTFFGKLGLKSVLGLKIVKIL